MFRLGTFAKQGTLAADEEVEENLIGLHHLASSQRDGMETDNDDLHGEDYSDVASPMKAKMKREDVQEEEEEGLEEGTCVLEVLTERGNQDEAAVERRRSMPALFEPEEPLSEAETVPLTPATNLGNSNKLASAHSISLYSYPDRRFMVLFPERLERWLAPFDDFIIRLCQLPNGRFFYWLSYCLTGLTTIEMIIIAPFILFTLGWDGAATQLVFFALVTALMSQVPKRFIWRYRPYMVGRAQKRKEDKTSSFPSRAVTCSVVYAFLLCQVYLRYYDSHTVEWWMFPLGISWVIITSYARVNLGVHYPSDCIIGVFQGILICFLGGAAWSLYLLGCPSCLKEDHNNFYYSFTSSFSDECYSPSSSSPLTIDYHHPERINWWLMVILLATFAAIVVVSMVKPIRFWVKGDRVFGLLLPCILFQALFLCPNDFNDYRALARGKDAGSGSVDWYLYVYGFGIGLLLTGLGVANNGRKAFMAWVVWFTATFSALVCCRLFLLR
ncbi:acidPPc domain-containing protein [Balamuthia mandrillaris]